IAQQERARAEQQAAEARFHSARAEREAANAREQLRVAEERTREAKAKAREAALEREKAAKRAQQAYSISEALLELNIDMPDLRGSQNSRQAVDTAHQVMNELLSEGFKPPRGAKVQPGPRNLGFTNEK